MKFRFVALLAISLLVVSACGSAPAKKTLPKLSAAPSATKTTGTLLDKVPSKAPTRPKDVESEKGAQEFGAYVMKLVAYVLATNKIDDLTAIADKNLCVACKQVSDGIADRGNEIQVANGPVTVKTGTVQSSKGGFYNVSQSVEFPDGSQLDSTTGKVSTSISGLHDRPMTVNLIWRNGTWVLLNYKIPKK